MVRIEIFHDEQTRATKLARDFMRMMGADFIKKAYEYDDRYGERDLRLAALDRDQVALCKGVEWLDRENSLQLKNLKNIKILYRENSMQLKNLNNLKTSNTSKTSKTRVPHAPGPSSASRARSPASTREGRPARGGRPANTRGGRPASREAPPLACGNAL